MEDEKDFVPNYNEEVSEVEEDLLVHIECPPDVLDPAVAGSSTEVEVEVAGRRVRLLLGPLVTPGSSCHGTTTGKILGYFQALLK